MANTTSTRCRKTGQYQAKFTHICKRCGQRNGQHEAVRPYAIDDAFMGDQCDGFKPSGVYLVWVPEKWELE